MPFNVPFPNFTPDENALSAQVNANFAAIVAQLNSVAFTGYNTYINVAFPAANTPTQNTAALQAAANLAVATPGGAIILFPAGIFQFNGTINVSGVGGATGAGGVVFQGSSTGTQLVQTVSADLFDVQMSPQSAGNYGVRFRDLQLTYLSTATTGVAINATNGGGCVTAEYCAFLSCPAAFTTGVGGTSLQCGLVGCTIQQNRNAGSTQVTLSAAQSFLWQTVIRQQPIGSSGPAGCTGVLLTGQPEGYVVNCHISDFTTGISITGNTKFCYIDNCAIPAYQTGIQIQPTSNSGLINGIRITNCYIPATATTGAGSTGIYIDTNGGTATNIDDIQIANTTVQGFANAGIQVNVAHGVYISGGVCSSNGLAPTAVALGAGIAVTGLADTIEVKGTSLIGVYQFNGGTQPYGAAISGGCTNVRITRANMQGNGTGALYYSAPGNNCYVRGCAGYNGLAQQVASITNLPASGVLFNAQTVNASSLFFGDFLVNATGSAITDVVITSSSQVNGIFTGATSLPLNFIPAERKVAILYGANGVKNFNVIGV